jgi:hypothetical protein
VERDHLEDPGVDGRVIFNWVLKQWNCNMEWIDLAYVDRSRALVDAVNR